MRKAICTFLRPNTSTNFGIPYFCTQQFSSNSFSYPDFTSQFYDTSKEKKPILPDKYRLLNRKSNFVSVHQLRSSVILVDKPLHFTSSDLCEKIAKLVRPAFRVKVGHAGTLDPLATGLIILCCGETTRMSSVFMAEDKVYEGTFRLGEGTASYDAESPVTEHLPWQHITDEDLQKATSLFRGTISQIPPPYSAVRINGRRLYDLAANGEIDRTSIPPRQVTIKEFEVERDPEDQQLVNFRVACSKGTYVRSLAYDFGKALNSTAYVTKIVRSVSGKFKLEDAWSWQSLTDQVQWLVDKETKRRANSSVPSHTPSHNGPRQWNNDNINSNRTGYKNSNSNIDSIV